MCRDKRSAFIRSFCSTITQRQKRAINISLVFVRLITRLSVFSPSKEGSQFFPHPSSGLLFCANILVAFLEGRAKQKGNLLFRSFGNLA